MMGHVFYDLRRHHCGVLSVRPDVNTPAYARGWSVFDWQRLSPVRVGMWSSRVMLSIACGLRQLHQGVYAIMLQIYLVSCILSIESGKMNTEY